MFTTRLSAFAPCALSCVAITASGGAQTSQPATVSTEISAAIEALARSVDAAHRPPATKTQVGKVRTLEAQIRLANTDRSQDNIHLLLNLKFGIGLTRVVNRKELTRDMIAYSLEEGGKTLRRGFDGVDYWLDDGSKKIRLGGRDFAADRELVRKQIAVSRQLLQSLDPGAILRNLQQPSRPRDADLVLSPQRRIACRMVEGNVPDHPFALQAPPEDKSRVGCPARLRVYIDRQSGLLLAIEARGLAENPQDRGELVVMPGSDYQQVDGLALPFVLLIYERQGQRLASRQKITILGARLNPGFTWQSFAMPK